MAEMAKRVFRRSFSCNNCGNQAIRVFEKFFNEKIMVSDEQFSIEPKVLSYIILDWWCCADEKCRNWFNRCPNLSRCPVCHNWSVLFSIEGENKFWKCQKKEDCGWNFSIIIKD